MADQVFLEVWKNHDGGIQVSISKLDGNGAGGGYRILGEKFCACCPRSLIAKKALDHRDAVEIARYASYAMEVPG